MKIPEQFEALDTEKIGQVTFDRLKPRLIFLEKKKRNCKTAEKLTLKMDAFCHDLASVLRGVMDTMVMHGT